VHVNGYKAMWAVVFFDLPTDTPEAKRRYSQFRKVLIEDGFTMMQFSVYARPCPSEENLEVHVHRVKAALPPDGEVRILTLTDKQFGRMLVFHGKIRSPTGSGPSQLEFF
jgi:CRISPR-associated protein Cas2